MKKEVAVISILAVLISISLLTSSCKKETSKAFNSDEAAKKVYKRKCRII